MVSFSSCRSGSGPLAVLSFGAVERNRRKPGGSGSGQARSSGAAKRSSGSLRPAKPAWPPCRERHDRPPRGATAALNRTGTGSDRHETEGQNGQGAHPSPNGHGNQAKLAPDLHPTARPVTSASATIRVSDRLRPRGRPVEQSWTVNSWHAMTRLPLPVLPACARVHRSPAGAQC